ncbi:hypothetical protein FB451DRAFT_1408329 [Mycena latifolia]|nr:hypothetical protein FB451DRAFT_1408329 [Mycena latifolia]
MRRIAALAYAAAADAPPTRRARVPRPPALPGPWALNQDAIQSHTPFRSLPFSSVRRYYIHPIHKRRLPALLQFFDRLSPRSSSPLPHSTSTLARLPTELPRATYLPLRVRPFPHSRRPLGYGVRRQAITHFGGCDFFDDSDSEHFSAFALHDYLCSMAALPASTIGAPESTSATAILNSAILPALRLAKGGVEPAINGVPELATMRSTMKANKEELSKLENSLNKLSATGASGDLTQRVPALSSDLKTIARECKTLAEKSPITAVLQGQG